MVFINASCSVFILRILALKASLIAMALVASSHFLYLDLHLNFDDIVTFRYVMAVAVLSLAYGVLQLSLAACHKMPPHFEFYTDQVMRALLGTGSGAGIAVCYEQSKLLYDIFNDVSTQFSQIWNEFWNKLLAASVFLFLAWLCLALISIIPNYNNTNPTLSIPPPPHHHHHDQPNTTLEPYPTQSTLPPPHHHHDQSNTTLEPYPTQSTPPPPPHHHYHHHQSNTMLEPYLTRSTLPHPHHHHYDQSNTTLEFEPATPTELAQQTYVPTEHAEALSHNDDVSV